MSKSFTAPAEGAGGVIAHFIEGVASTQGFDQQAEKVLQHGMDFSYFLDKGFVNWNHSMAPEDQLGVPEHADIREHDGMPAMYIRARLFDPKEMPRVGAVLGLMKSLEPLGRQLGFSVQGEVTGRDPRNPRIIVKSVIRHVSLTHEPVNAETFAHLAKALTGEAAAPVLQEDLDAQLTSILWGSDASCGHYNPQTGQFRDLRAAVEHLVHCQGHDPKSAQRALLRLQASGIFL